MILNSISSGQSGVPSAGLSAGFVDPLPPLSMSAALAAIGLLVTPSAGYALWRLMGRKPSRSPVVLRRLRPTLLILALPAVLLLGQWAINTPSLTWLLLPLLHVLAVGIPVVWLLFLGVRNLPLGPAQRMWGVIASGLTIGPLLILAAELIALLLFLVVGVFLIASQPDLAEEIATLAEWLVEIGEPTPEMLTETLGPYLLHPAFILAVFTFAALVVPLIEEALKPVGAWLLLGRDLTPAAGFAAGAMSGAGFALFESLVMTAGIDDWATLAVARAGTAGVHIFTAGMAGWALTIAWRERRIFLFGVTYAGAVALHSLWNGITLLVAFALMAETFGPPVAPPAASSLPLVESAASIGLVFLALVVFAALLWVNRYLARSSQARHGPQTHAQGVSLDTAPESPDADREAP